MSLCGYILFFHLFFKMPPKRKADIAVKNDILIPRRIKIAKKQTMYVKKPPTLDNLPLTFFFFFNIISTAQVLFLLKNTNGYL